MEIDCNYLKKTSDSRTVAGMYFSLLDNEALRRTNCEYIGRYIQQIVYALLQSSQCL